MAIKCMWASILCACARACVWCRIGVESKLQYKPRVVRRNAGLSQAFDQRPEDAIDTVANRDALVYNAQSSFFPIIIHIEAATPTAMAPGQRLCRNSQCTFVALERTEDGAYRTKIMKQKLLVDGAEIETQEIYGIDPSNDPECVICMTAPKDTACLPCRHMCMCSGCAKIHNMHADTCPICRTRVESILRINDPAAAKSTGGQLSAQAADSAPRDILAEQAGHVPSSRGVGGSSIGGSDGVIAPPLSSEFSTAFARVPAE